MTNAVADQIFDPFQIADFLLLLSTYFLIRLDRVSILIILYVVEKSLVKVDLQCLLSARASIVILV